MSIEIRGSGFSRADRYSVRDSRNSALLKERDVRTI